MSRMRSAPSAGPPSGHCRPRGASLWRRRGGWHAGTWHSQSASPARQPGTRPGPPAGVQAGRGSLTPVPLGHYLRPSERHPPEEAPEIRMHICRLPIALQRFPAPSLPWCAQRKRPSGGCALACTHLHGLADREGSWADLTHSPCPSPLLGRPGAPLAAFLPESAISLICRVRAAEGARSKEEAEGGRERVR